MKKKHRWECNTPPISKFMRVMKLSVLLLLVFTLQVSAKSSAQKVQLNSKGQNLKTVLKELKKQTGYYIMYNEKDVDNNLKVDIDVNGATLEQALQEILEGLPLQYSIIDDYILIRKKAVEAPVESTQQEKKVITGSVIDESGEPIPGANVFVKGTQIGTITDFNGQYSLEMPAESDVLIFSFIGMETQEHALVGQKIINVTLASIVNNVNEVVVVGYGTTKVRDLTGSVASIAEKDLEVKNVASAASLLQNMAAGVSVSGNTGRPGEIVRIRVRGATSLTGANDPLYVIDGVPSDDPEVLNSISPTDIATFDVLKDASASAIYGSRASNGVVLITTKRGRQNEKAKFNVNYNGSHDSQIKNFTILDGDQFRAYVTDVAEKTLVVDPGNRTATSILNPDDRYLGTENTDWFDEVKQTARRHNVDLSVRGGSENVTYFVSGSMMDHQGMVVNDDMKRYSGRVNLGIDINPFFRIGTNMNVSYIRSNQSGTSMFAAQAHRPDLPIYKEDGVTFYDDNPVANSTKINASDEYRFAGTVFGELDLYKGLKFKSSFSANQSMSYNYQFSPSYLSWNDKASASRAEGRYYKTVFDNTLSYNNTFNEVHSLDFVGGISMEEQQSQSAYLSKTGFPMDEIYINVSGGTDFNRASDSKTERGLFSSFARLNYKYNDKYMMTFTGRYDGSSMFGKNNRYGFFPSGALAWRINKEPFLQNVNAINDLKLKVSAGKTGIQNLSSYSNRDLYKAAKYNDKPGIEHSQIGNKDIQWELSTQYDVGIDFALFNYWLSGSLGYYVKDTEGLIREFSFPSSMAVPNMYYNVGAVKNQGFELFIKSKIINRGDVKWDIGVNLATNKNEVTNLEKEGAVENSSGTIVQGTGAQVLAIGHPMGAFFGYEYNGIIQSQERIDELNQLAIANGFSTYNGELFPGNLEMRDLNGDGRIDQKDKTIIGNPDPDLFGGINTTFSYKRLDVMANFGFQIGGLKQYGKALQNIPGQLTGLVDYNLDNRWSPDNTDASIPAIYLEQGVASFTDIYLYDASYFRLQDLKIAYNLPEYKGVSGQVYVTGSNLFTLTSYPGTDPATVNSSTSASSSLRSFGGNYETSYPGIRTFSVGLKLTL
ncbi:TonB-dependent receptor [Carboxylicivirga taeanensis]|uniref:TonB-dependent receptor n=1 Tax=Carboxylicivirga taeanensis TaxID=1416875 RepID=UPI003F6E4379